MVLHLTSLFCKCTAWNVWKLSDVRDLAKQCCNYPQKITNQSFSTPNESNGWNRLLVVRHLRHFKCEPFICYLKLSSNPVCAHLVMKLELLSINCSFLKTDRIISVMKLNHPMFSFTKLSCMVIYNLVRNQDCFPLVMEKLKLEKRSHFNVLESLYTLMCYFHTCSLPQDFIKPRGVARECG